MDPDSLRFVFLPSYTDIESVRQWELAQSDTTPKEGEGRRGRRERRAEEDFVLPDLTWPSSLRYSFVPQADPLGAKLFFNNYAVSDMRLVLHYKQYVDTAELMLPQAGDRKKLPDTAAFKVTPSPSALFFQDSLLLDFNFPVVGVDFGKASVLEFQLSSGRSWSAT